jgi:ribosomal protein S17E
MSKEHIIQEIYERISEAIGEEFEEDCEDDDFEEEKDYVDIMDKRVKNAIVFVIEDLIDSGEIIIND